MDRQRTQNENIIGLKVGSFNSQSHITQFINKLEFSVLLGNEFCVNTEKNYNMALTGSGFHFLVSSSFSFGTNFCVFLLLQSCQTYYNTCISKPSDAFKCHHKKPNKFVIYLCFTELCDIRVQINVENKCYHLSVEIFPCHLSLSYYSS